MTGDLTEMTKISIAEWTDVFAAIGNDERLSIMIVLSGSDYILHSHMSNGDNADAGAIEPGCLPFSDIAKAIEASSASRLSYHLSKLLEANLVCKIPAKDAKERVFPLYKVTSRWQKFATEFGFNAKIKEYVKHKYPESFYEKAP